MEFKNPTEIDWDKAPLNYLVWSLVFILMVIIKYWLIGATAFFCLDLSLGLILGLFTIDVDFIGFAAMAFNHLIISSVIFILFGYYFKDIELFFFRRRLQKIVDKSNKEFNDRKYINPKPLDYKEPKKMRKKK